jgi:hypothetical protein
MQTGISEKQTKPKMNGNAKTWPTVFSRFINRFSLTAAVF